MDNLNLRGQPDRALLNRHEKWEVDHFATQFAVKYGQGRETYAAKVRRMLPYVPGHLRSRNHIEQWLIANWERYI